MLTAIPIDVPLAGFFLADARTRASVDLGSLAGLTLAVLIRHRY